MRTIHRYEFSRFFGGRWPMFPFPQEDVTAAQLAEEFQREETGPLKRYTVYFELGARQYMVRHFWSQAEMLGYMRRWGLSTTDISDITEHDWQYSALVPTWRVVARDDFYGTRSGWYLPTEQAAEDFADRLPAQWHVMDIFPTIRRVRFCAPYGNDTKIPFNPR